MAWSELCKPLVALALFTPDFLEEWAPMLLVELAALDAQY
jgi:hypothetical protein